MDSSIRQLLAAGNLVKREENAKRHLLKAFKLLESGSKDSEGQDRTQACGTDLYVIAAELAFKLHENKIAESCLTMYFHGTPLTDQFLCRAYICQANLLADASPESSSALDSAVVYLLKAINFAKDKARYHFIVYNASVMFWKMARPFMREGTRGILHTSLGHIVKALEDIDDKDYEWRSTLLILYIQSLVDAGKSKEASKVSESAAEFTLQQSKFQYKEVLKLQIKYQLVDIAKLQKQVKTMPEYTVFLRVQKLKNLFANGQTVEKLNFKKEIEALLNVISPKPLAKLPVTPGSKQTKRTDSASSGSSANLEPASPARRRSRAFSKGVNLPILNEEDLVEMGKEVLKPLLLEMARLCGDHDEVDVSYECLNLLKDLKDIDTSMNLEIECLECYLHVKELGDSQHAYTKASIDVRMFAVKKLDQTIQNAVRSARANVIQSACVTQWNLCLPMLQVNLRKLVRRPLTLVAQALENISSLLIKLRCQIHTELAKCEEDVEQVEAAIGHLRKAIQLDQSGFYHHRLHTMLRRLELSTQLYKNPESPEDTAAVIIEQARKSADSGSIRMKRSLLVKAGLALAPDAFQYVLDSESEVKTVGSGSKQDMEIFALGAKANQWNKCTRKAAGHLKRLGDENDRERVRLWADLAKVARKQEVWDVCRVAARFCLLYDDDRWKVTKSNQEEGTKSQQSPTNGTEGNSTNPPTSAEQSAAVEQSGIVVTNIDNESIFHNRDLIRLLAEVHFINGESLVHLMQCEGFKLNEIPTSPGGKDLELDSDFSFIDNPNWQSYVNWIKDLSSASTAAFLRAITLGVNLNESWIACSGTSYLWNYNNHLILDKNYAELVKFFSSALQGLQSVGHSTETVLLVKVCNVIAQGLLTKWIPAKPSKNESPVETSKTPVSKTSSRNKTPGKDKNANSGSQVVSVDPDAMDDLKEALEVCEYALNVTNGNNLADVVPTSIRESVIATWVLLKQMLQQQIGPELGSDKEMLENQKGMTIALVALECHLVNKNGMLEMTVPGLDDVTELVSSAKWDDSSIEVQVWVKLAHLCITAKEVALVTKCCKNALKFRKNVKDRMAQSANKHGHREIVDCEMLAYAACIQGENILSTVTSNPFARRQAVESFVTSARFADMAGNYNLVMAACKRWWNACLPLMSTEIERELLKKPLHTLLHCITNTSIKSKTSGSDDSNVLSKTTSLLGITVTEDDTQDANTDNAVRAAMYGIYFQTFTDKGLWEDALSAMDQAVHHMPRTKHRLLIFKHRIMVRAKLGRSVFADIAKFREESEEYVAHMWHRVALSSHEKMQQIQSYQRAIESLHSEETQWKKVDYLSEMAAWLYCNEFPKDDAINVLEWAVDILLNMKFEDVVKEDSDQSLKSKGKKGALGKASKTPASRGSKAGTKGGKREQKAEPKSKPATAEALVDKSSPGEENEKKAEEYIPIEKNVIIGLENAQIDLKVNQLNSVRQLEGLIRAHVMLATVAGRSSMQHKVYSLMAVGFVVRLWQISLTAAGPLISQLPKIEVPETKGQKGASQPATTKETKGQKRTGNPNAIPEDVMAWSKYEVPDDIRRAFVFNTTETAISDKTISKPTLTVHYLQELCSELSSIGYDHLTLPVFALTEVIVHDIVKSESWSQLIRIQQIKVCYDMNLSDSAKYWESVVGDNYLPQEEQAAFLQEVELIEQHAKQVKHEEERIKGQTGKQTFKESLKQEDVISVITLQGEKLGKLDMKRVWLGKAKALLELGYHQESRKLLDQAMEAAKFHKDKKCEGDITIALAQLSLREANYGQAIKYLQIAEAIAGDERYWLKIIILMVDSILQNPDVNEDDFKASIDIMKHSYLTFEVLKQTRPTKDYTIGHALASIKSKMSLLKLKLKVQRDSRVRESIYVELNKLEDAEHDMANILYVRDLGKVYQNHAKLLLVMAKEDSNSPTEVHSLLLSGMNILSNGIQHLQELCCSIRRTVTDKVVELVLPVERDLCDISLDYVDFCLYAFEVDAQEKCIRKKTEAKTGSLEHIVREYVGQSPHSSDLESQWEEVCNNLPQQILSLLSDIHSLAKELSEKVARSLLLCGKCFRLLSVYSRDNITSQWDVEKLNIVLQISNESLETKASDQSIAAKSHSITSRVGSTRSKTSTTSNLTIRQRTKLMDNASRLNSTHEMCKMLMSQANEILVQSLKLALDHQIMDIICEASIELFECNGQFDPILASQFLALHQSAVSSMEMKNLIYSSQTDSSVSNFSALIHQQNWLSQNSQSEYMLRSTVGSWISKSLLEFNAWKRIQILPTHFDLLKDFPPNFNFVVLQHSLDGKYIYAAVMDRPSASSASDGKKGKDKSQDISSRAHVERFPINPNTLSVLLEKMEDWGIRLMSLLLQTEYQRSQAAMRQKMLQQLTVDGGNDSRPESNTALLEQEEEEMKIMEEFKEIMELLESYFSPVTNMIYEKLIKQIVEDGQNSILQGTEADPNSMETIVLLMDSNLLQLPMETLKCFQTPFIDCIARDFSLQFIHHRWYFDPEAAANLAEKKKTDAKNTPKAKDSRKTPGGGGLKVVPLNREVLPGCKSVSTNSFHYAVDPLEETADTEKYKPIEVMNEVLQTYASTCTSAWTGLKGSNGVPSIGNWEETINDAEAFIFYGMERFLANVMPSKIVSMNLDECGLFVMLDKAQTNKSFRHQSKVDVDKSNFQLHLEKPLQTVMLLSLVGANSVCINQWHSTLEENAGKLHEIAKFILDDGRVIGKSVRNMFNPSLEKPSPPTPSPPVAAQTKEAKGGKGKGGKGSAKGKRSSVGMVTPLTPEVVEEEVIVEEKVEEVTPEPVEIQHSWCNFVIFGLPNVMVT